jgi:hypothetical protein
MSCAVDLCRRISCFARTRGLASLEHRNPLGVGRTMPFNRQMMGAVLLSLSMSSAVAEPLRLNLVPRAVVEARLGKYGGTNRERGATLERMFVEAGCGEHLSEQSVPWSKVPNRICVLPGQTGQVIIVGAHFDRVPEGHGVADNWSGASLLPSLYQSIKNEPRRHTYIFIGFTDEETGLVEWRQFRTGRLD